MSRMQKSSRNGKIAAMGIGAMIVFIALVLVAGIAASVLIQTAGMLEKRGMETGQQTTAEVSTGIKITDIEGHHNLCRMTYNQSTGLFWNYSGRDDGVAGESMGLRKWRNYSRIHNMTISCTPRAGSMSIDLSTTLVEISNSSRKCLLTYDSSQYQTAVDTDGVFGTSAFELGPDDFGIIIIEDYDSSCGQISPVINRGDMIMLTINTSACFFGLEGREDVWGTVIPEEGASAIFSFRIPASLSDTIYDMF